MFWYVLLVTLGDLWDYNIGSIAETWTRVSRVRAEYPNQLDYNIGFVAGSTCLKCMQTDDIRTGD